MSRKVCQPTSALQPIAHAGEREVRHHDAEQDPPRHAALREAALEQEDEARPDEQHQQRVAVRAVAEPPQPRGALVLGDGHRVDLAGPAVVEVAGVGVVEAVLALPPAVGREEQEAEQVAPAGVGRPRLEHRVVGQVVEERVHPHQEHGRRPGRGRPRAERPGWTIAASTHTPRYGRTTLAICARLRVRSISEVGGQVLLPALAVGDLCGVHVGLRPWGVPRVRTPARASWISDASRRRRRGRELAPTRSRTDPRRRRACERSPAPKPAAPRSSSSWPCRATA